MQALIPAAVLRKVFMTASSFSPNEISLRKERWKALESDVRLLTLT